MNTCRNMKVFCDLQTYQKTGQAKQYFDMVFSQDQLEESVKEGLNKVSGRQIFIIINWEKEGEKKRANLSVNGEIFCSLYFHFVLILKILS